MKVPETPANEIARLAALETYKVLDTEGEASFDALARLAASIAGTPIALVSLIDDKRQWFKARYGLDVAETSREISFCGHVVAEGRPLIIPDAFADLRFADNPLTTGDPHVRFYAGMPLQTPDGFVLGSLCAIDHIPRQLTSEQVEMLDLLAHQVVDQLEARRRRLQLAEERGRAMAQAERLKTLFEAMVEGVLVQGRDGVITEANPAAERILGKPVAELSGSKTLDPRWRTVQANGQPLVDADRPSIVTLRTGVPSLNIVMGLHKPSGELTWVSVNALPLRRAGESDPYAAITTFHDITAVKAAQERLAQQERLVTTGTLAAGVGHEINNPLSYVLSNIEFALGELESPRASQPEHLQEVVGLLTEARDGAKMIGQIVRGLRAFAREETAPVPTDVASAIEISVNVARHEVRHKATLSLRLEPTPAVLADESRLCQVLVNLLVNAAQAFAGHEIDDHRITLSTALAPDGRVAISVADNGPGIPLALQRRVFDPFFTTKPMGQGTGLGLSISHSIVTALGGELLLESVPGHGTTFQILLPASAAAPVVKPTPAPIAGSGPRGRVLIVDDEDFIVKIITRAIAPTHEVVGVTDPREAISLLEEGERFDVIFSDMMMPYLGGSELYARVKAIDPAMAGKMVFVSGGATDAKGEAFLESLENERLDKPFSPQELKAVIQRLLRSDPQRT